MKKRYTKKQIIESIKYWQKQLNEGWSEDVMGLDEMSDVDEVLNEIDPKEDEVRNALIDFILWPDNYKIIKPLLSKAAEYDDNIALFAGIIPPYVRKRQEIIDFQNK